MKSIFKIIITSYFIFITSYLTNAQIAINSDGTSPDASAMLDITSTDKGILIPRMTTTEREAINSPATGLLAYDTENSSFWYYNGTGWSEVGSAAFTTDDGLTQSINNDDDFVFGADSLNYGTGMESKLFYDKSKFALRAGGIQGTDWDESNLGDYSIGLGVAIKASGYAAVALGDGVEATGNYSIAFGLNTEAQGDNSTAFGSSTDAIGIYSTAFGSNTEAQGDNSTAFGNSTTANGYSSTAFGISTTAEGSYTTAFGVYTTAYSLSEIAIGIHNTAYTPNSTNAFDSEDRLFVIGNGTSTSDLSDAFVVNKNGNVSLNGALTIDSSYTFPITDGINGQALTTDGSGTLSWITQNDTLLTDADGDTKIQVEESSDEDIIRFDLGGTEYFRMNNGRISVVNTGYSIFLGNNTGVNDDFTDNANVFIGNSAGRYNTSGEYNIYIGNQSGNNNTTGYKNVFLGYSAGKSNLTGYHNLSLGYQAGFSNDGSQNIFLGYQAGYNETGSNKLYIENSDATSPLIYGEFDNDRLVINGNDGDNSNNRTLFVNGSIGATSAFNNDSDRRLKTDIQTIPNALNKILEMRGVTYQWKDGRETGDRMGFIAQEVEPILPEVVDNKNDHYTMQYAPITAVLVEAVKEQQIQIKEQQTQIETLQSENTVLKGQAKKINQLEQQNAEMKAMLEQIQVQLNNQ